jgi:peptide/nickel transport system substrate-binding protein
MLKHTGRLALAAAVGLGLAVSGGVAKAETPKKGGILSFVVASDLPSFDGHRETTFGVIHPLAPIYSLLIRVNPANPGDPTDFECDLCVGKVPTPENDGKKYTFKLRKGVKFHDGTPLTSADVKATYDKIIFPPEGVPSARKSYYRMVDKISTPDDRSFLPWPTLTTGSIPRRIWMHTAWNGTRRT